MIDKVQLGKLLEILVAIVLQCNNLPLLFMRDLKKLSEIFLLEINDSNGANDFYTYVSLLFHQPFSSLKLQLKAPTPRQECTYLHVL